MEVIHGGQFGEKLTMVALKASETKLDTEAIGRAGRARYEALKPELERLPQGSFVIIAVETGDYVTGPSLGEADDAFEAKYGDIPAYVRRIGRLTRV